MGCSLPKFGTFGVSSLQQTISKAAFDLNANEKDITCVKQWQGQGQAVYILEYNNQQYRYEQFGTVVKKVDWMPQYKSNNNLNNESERTKLLEEGKTSNHPVIGKAAFDYNVNINDVKMITQQESMGNGDYLLLINGKYVKYKKIGSCYLPENQSIL